MARSKKAAADAYSDTRDEVFAHEYLRSIGYQSVKEFRQDGFKYLGKDEHQKQMVKLHQFGRTEEAV